MADQEISSDPKEFRYGVRPERYAEWVKLYRRVGLPQTQILHRLVDLLLDSDEVTQLMLLRQLTPRPDLIALVLRRLGEGGDQKEEKPLKIPATRAKPIAAKRPAKEPGDGEGT